MNNKEVINVLLVDDHPMVRRGLRFFLDTQPDIHIIDEAENSEKAQELVTQHVPDIVLLDLILPTLGGVETTRRIKAISPSTKIIILTSSEDGSTVLPAITAGASAYLLKDINPEELCDTLRRVASGEVVITPRLATILVTKMAQPAVSNSPGTQLTPREIEVLRLVAQGKSNGEIAKDLFLSDKTVKTHVSNILAKLQLADRTQAAIFAWKEGILEEK
jgi:two-component system, NarL family, response regulator LiaR